MKQSLDQLKGSLRPNRSAFIAIAIYLSAVLIALLLIEILIGPENNLQLYRRVYIFYGAGVILLTAALIYWLGWHNTTQLRRSEARYHQLYDQAPEGIFVMDRAGHCFDANPACCALLGYSREELLHLKIIDLIAPNDLAQQPLLLDSLIDGQAAAVEYHLKRKDGMLLMAELNVHAIEPDRVVAMLRDVTARQQAEASLQASEAQLRALFRAMTDVILVLDEQGRYLQIAPTSPSLLARPSRELLGKCLHDIFSPDQADLFLNHIRRALDTRAPVHCEYLLNLDHQAVWFAATISPLADDKIIWVARDITEQKRRAEQIATINTMGRALAELLDLAQIYQQLTLAVQHLFPDLLALIISRYDPAQRVFTCVYGFEEGQTLDTSLFPPIPLEPLGYGAQSEAFHMHRTIVVNDLPQRLKQAQTNLVVGSLPLAAVYAPLLTQGEVIGVMQVQCATYNRFAPEDGEVLSFLASTAAIALQNARLFEAEHQQRMHAEALAQLAARLNAQIELDAVLQITCEETAHALNAPAASVYLYDEALDALIFSGGYGLPAFYGQCVTPAPRAMFDAYTTRPDRLMITPDIQAIPNLPDAALYAQSDLRTIVGAVLKREERLIGVLNVKSIGTVRQFSGDELALLTALAAQAAIAIENTRLVEAERRQRELAEALRDSAEALNSTLHTEEVLDQILAIVTRLVPNDATNIIALEDQVGRVIRWSGFVLPGQEGAIYQLTLPLAQVSNLRYIVETGKPWVTGDTHNDPDWVMYPPSSWIRSYIGVPIRAKGRTLGVLAANSMTPNFYTAEHAQQLSAVAAQAAIALENAQLFDETQQRVRELATLYDSSLAITSTLDKSTVLHSVTERIAQAVAATSTYLVWCDWEHDTGAIIAEYFSPQANAPERLSDLGVVHRLSDYPGTLAALRAGHYSIAQLSQPDADPAVIEDLMKYGGRSSLCVPLSTASQVRGYIVIWDSRVERAWTDSEIRVCQTLANQAAVALENVELYETTQRSTTEQAALLEASRAISSTLDLPTMLQRLAEQMGRAIGATSTYICEWDPRTESATVLADYYGPQTKPEERVSDLGHSYNLMRDMGLSAAWLASSQATIAHVDDPDQPELHRQHMRQYGAQSILTVPLEAKGTIFGYAELWESRCRREFTPDEISLCHSMAQQAAIAFENARLFEAERRQLRLAQTLRDVGALLTAEMNLDEVFDYLFDLLAHVVRYDSVSIQLINDNQIVMAAGRGFTNFAHAQNVVQSILPPIIAERWAQPHHRVLVISNTAHDPRWYRIPGNEHIRSWVGAALRVKGRLLGVLNIDSNTPNAYDEATGETAAAFANQAAIAIENAQLHEATRRHADELETRVSERTAALELERRRTAAILDAAGEGIVTTDLQGTIEYLNPALERLTGYTASEAIGQNPRLWQSGRTPVSQYQKMWGTIKRGGIWQGELVNRRQDGTFYDAALTIAPLFDIDGQLSGFVGIQHDISQQKELDRLKDEFVSNVSHELRTPIANVKLYLSLLTRGKPDKYEEYLQTLRREAIRLEKLIEDLLDLSRLDLGKTPISLSPTDVNQLAAQLIADRTALAASRDLLIDYHAEGQLPYVQADPAMLGQVMSNLLTNAINYTPHGGLIMVTTALRQDEEREWITFTVQDTGPGLSAKDLPHVFERFYRGEAGRKSGAPGTGLGLAISAQIMAKLEGRITVESQAGQGAAFIVWLKPA